MRKLQLKTINELPANYVNILRNLSNNDKLDLIVLLTQSLKKQEKTNEKISAKDFYGIWGDDGYDDEQFVAEIKGSRTFKCQDIEL